MSLQWRIPIFIAVLVFTGITLQNIVMNVLEYTRPLLVPEIGLGEMVWTTFVRSLPTVLGPTVIFAAVVFIYLIPLAKTDRALRHGRALSPEQLQRARSRMLGLSRVLIATYGLGFILGGGWFALEAYQSGFMEGWLVLLNYLSTIALGFLLAFLHIGIEEVTFSRLRRDLELYFLSEKELTRVVTLRARVTFFTAAALVFAVLFSWFSVEYARPSYLDTDNLNQVQQYLQYDYLPREENPEALLINRYVILSIILAAIIFILIQVAKVWTRGMTAQLREIRTRLHEINEGGGDLTKRILILQADEIGVVTHQINTQMNNLESILMSVADATKSVEKTSTGLSNAIEGVSAFSEEILASASEVASHTSNQMMVLMEVRKTIGIMLENLEDVFKTVDNQAIYVEETSSTINEMVASIQSVSESTTRADDVASSLVDVSREAKKAVLRSLEAINEIQAASEEVETIIGLISNIANQTNLLSMNAAIEAAHAGVHGKGFAVVADEVRKLAEDSGSRASEVVEQIHTMSERVENGVSMSETTDKSLTKITGDIEQAGDLIKSIAMAMKEQSTGATQILQAVGTVVDATQTIKSKANEERENSMRIQMAMEQLDQVSTEITTAVEEQRKANEEIITNMDDVKHAAHYNTDVVHQLRALVDRFKIGSKHIQNGNTRPEDESQQDEAAQALILGQ